MRRRTVDLSAVTMLVLDEADQMLAMGFQEDVEYIMGHLPEERVTALFSATIPMPILISWAGTCARSRAPSSQQAEGSLQSLKSNRPTSWSPTRASLMPFAACWMSGSLIVP